MPDRPSQWDHPVQSVAGKAAIVTGGTTGIGRAVAKLLASQGARVLIVSRSREHVEEALEEIRPCGQACGLAADVAEEAGVQALFAEADRQIGPVDILVNNVGIAGPDITEVPYADVAYTLRANLLSYLACAAEALKRMKGRGGNIVNLGSMSSQVREVGSGPYVATKAAILGWSESLRKTYNRWGVKVTLIEPGNVNTPIHKGDDAAAKAQMVRENRMLAPEDIAELILFCLTRPGRCDIILSQVRPHGQYI